jgi:hypothetical protein
LAATRPTDFPAGTDPAFDDAFPEDPDGADTIPADAGTSGNTNPANNATESNPVTNRNERREQERASARIDDIGLPAVSDANRRRQMNES